MIVFKTEENDLACAGCENTYQGYFKEMPLSNTVYVANCPKCGEEYVFSNKIGWAGNAIPEGAVAMTEKLGVSTGIRIMLSRSVLTRPGTDLR